MTVTSKKTAISENTITHILGYPRVGSQRELKFAQERYWRGEIDQTQLKQVGQELRHRHWDDQINAGLDYVSVGDFAWYDHVLGTSMLLGHIPTRHQKGFPDLDTLFSVARGKAPTGCACAAADMTKCTIILCQNLPQKTVLTSAGNSCLKKWQKQKKRVTILNPYY